MELRVLPGKARTASTKGPVTSGEGVPPHNHKGGRSDQARATFTKNTGVTIWALSRREAEVNRHVCEDADYLHLDRKDPMKLTVPWDWLWAFPAQLSWKAKRPPSGGTYGQGTVSGRQFLWGVGLPKGNGGVQRFPRPDGDWPSSAKAEGSLTARPTRRAGTKADLPQELTSTGGLAPRCRLFATWGCSMFKGWAVRPLKRLAFATAPVGSLNQATAYESPAHSSTGTRSEPRAPPTAWELTVSCSISLPDGGSFHPSLTVLLRYRSPRRCSILLLRLAARRLYCSPTTPFSRFRLLPFRSPLLRESLLLSFPLATKMFQFARLSLACPWIQQQFERLTYSGISGSMLIFNSPKHFVAYYALPRLWVPRYPPISQFYFSMGTGKGYNSAVECHLDVVEVISSSLIIPKPNGWLYFWERTPGEYEAHGYKLGLGMKDNSESALSTNKEAISNATMNLMESSILAQDERWRHA
ncbi:hypothetical protein E3N88_25333 [Mikania micrantha]|uniref:Uncharacterized protein n=1 Tax=Mikania micrantha TaxID=192012 RepID=A0A5N6N4F8_9ASTR|nr:hypothetical protein E3N88_25333 [Mikania micrantha]